MISIRLTSKSRALAIATAIKTLANGGVIAFATETVYGIGCDPRNARAVNRMFAIKGRNEKKPCQLIAGSGAQVNRLASSNRFEKRAMAKYWPGPLTLLLRLKSVIRLAPRVSPKRVIGIRVTPDRFMRDLINAYGFPIAATSANRSGEKPATSGRGVRRAFEGQGKRVRGHGVQDAPDLLIDAGAIPRRRPTTVAQIAADGHIEIIRQGGMRIGSLTASS